MMPADEEATGEQHGRHAFVLARYAGEHGGAARCTVLLCEALVRIGHQVTLLLGSVPDADTELRLARKGVAVVTPIVRIGSRWSLPQRAIVLQLALRAVRHPRAPIYVVGLADEARYLLTLPLPNPRYMWETTEALPDIQFVDRRIASGLRKATAVLVPSQTIARNVRSTYRYSGRTALLPFWVEPPAGEPCVGRRRTGRVLYVGRMDPAKGFDTLASALEVVAHAGVQVTLEVCGPGSPESLGQLAEGKRVEFIGFVSADELARRLGDADALILPSRSEGYPLSLLEMCSHGRPVIATEVGSIPEIFGDRPCALLVPANDPVRLAEAILTLEREEHVAYERRCRDALAMFGEINDLGAIDGRLRQIRVMTPHTAGLA